MSDLKIDIRKGLKKGTVIWLTGISGSGKTTLGLRLKVALESLGFVTKLLDGDEVRTFFENDLGYTRAERIMNVRRIAFAARVLSDSGVTVVVANIAPYFEVREFIRKKLPKYIQIYLKTSLEAVAKRDVQGHYRKYNAGKLDNLIGVDDQYEIPRSPDLIVNTDSESVDISFSKIINFLFPYKEA